MSRVVMLIFTLVLSFYIIITKWLFYRKNILRREKEHCAIFIRAQPHTLCGVYRLGL